MIAQHPAKKSLLFATAAGILLILSLTAIALPFRESREIVYWLWVIALLIFTLNITALSFLFPPTLTVWRVWTIAASAFVLVIFPLSWLQILTALVVYGGLLEMQRSIVRSKEQSVRFSYYDSVKKGMRVLLTALVFLLAVNVYLKTADNITANPNQFYRDVANTIVRGVEPVLSNQIEGFRTDMTLDEFLVRTDFAGLDDFESAPSLSGNEFIQARERFFALFGINATGDEQALNVMRQLVAERVREILQPVEAFIPILYALVIFLSLRFVLPVVVWIAAPAGSLLFYLLVQLGWVKMVDKTVTVKVPELA